MSQNQLPATGSHKLLARFRNQFRKTEICRFFEEGTCWRGSGCPWAHGEEELQAPPNLNKTSLCKKWQNNQCDLPSSECPYAHGTSELRLTQAFEESISDGTLRRRDLFSKTQLCRFFEEGQCLKGSECEFAHGQAELHPLPSLRSKVQCQAQSEKTSNLDTYEPPVTALSLDDLVNKPIDVRSRLQHLGMIHLKTMSMDRKTKKRNKQLKKMKKQKSAQSGDDESSQKGERFPMQQSTGQHAVLPQCEISNVPCTACALNYSAVAPACEVGGVRCFACMLEAGLLTVASQQEVGGVQCVACMIEAGLLTVADCGADCGQCVACVLGKSNFIDETHCCGNTPKEDEQTELPYVDDLAPKRSSSDMQISESPPLRQLLPVGLIAQTQSQEFGLAGFNVKGTCTERRGSTPHSDSAPEHDCGTPEAQDSDDGPDTTSHLVFGVCEPAVMGIPAGITSQMLQAAMPDRYED